MKFTTIRKMAVIFAAMAMVSALVPLGAQAGVKVPKSETTLVFPLPVNLSQSFFVEVGNQGANTPTLSDAEIALHWIMEGDSGDTMVEGATGTYCDDRTNSPNEILRVYKTGAHGSLDIDALLSGWTTDPSSGEQNYVEQPIPEDGPAHIAGGSKDEIPILRVCQ